MKNSSPPQLFVLAACGLLQTPLALADNGYSGFDVSDLIWMPKTT
jgi:hypothetical protein